MVSLSGGLSLADNMPYYNWILVFTGRLNCLALHCNWNTLWNASWVKSNKIKISIWRILCFIHDFISVFCWSQTTFCYPKSFSKTIMEVSADCLEHHITNDNSSSMPLFSKGISRLKGKRELLWRLWFCYKSNCEDFKF